MIFESTRNYEAAVGEIFQILGRAWDDPQKGAASITKEVTAIDWGYIPAITFPGREVVNYSGRIGGSAGYQTVMERRIGSTERYSSTGMLGIQVRYPHNDLASVKIARMLSQTCQTSFRRAKSDWITFLDSKIIEVGYMKGYYQINVFITCRFEVDA